jgi:hypothetical protein
VNFNRRDVLRTGLLTAAACCIEPLLIAEDALSVSDHVFGEAERVFKNTRHTKYQHKQFVDEATGTYDVDCSDFVSYVLSRVAKRHLALIPKESWWPVPRAYKYYEFFAALPTDATQGWRRVERLEDARRGDIIAWQLAGEIRKTHDTGHVWVVAETPSSPGGQLMAVRAYDSAAMPHYDDTRILPDGTFQDGVGEGTFHLRVDEAGKPVAFQFGPNASFHEDPIAIGRILPL